MIRRLRKTVIKKDEIIADAVFLLVSFVITFIALFVFDIHWNFYPGGQLFPPAKHVFENNFIYLWGGLLGGVIGFFIIKLFLLGLKKEESIWRKNS